MRKPLIAGNWKMHGSLQTVAALVAGIKQGADKMQDIDILLLPTFIHLSPVQKLLGSSALLLGAQNLYPGQQGAFTGEVAGHMIKEAGCHFVLVGHSERRSLFHESNEVVAAKFQAALDAQLTPILCVGETQQQREANKTEQVIADQLSAVCKWVDISDWRDAVIAYEPVWAIGTGLTATPNQAQHVHAFIRTQIAQNQVDIARTIRILYGGSVKPDNAAALFAQPDIDGGLIGGASLEAKSFLDICKAALSSQQNRQVLNRKEEV